MGCGAGLANPEALPVKTIGGARRPRSNLIGRENRDIAGLGGLLTAATISGVKFKLAFASANDNAIAAELHKSSCPTPGSIRSLPVENVRRSKAANCEMGFETSSKRARPDVNNGRVSM